MNTAKPTEPTTHPHRQTPLDFTALWMRVVVAGLVIVAAVWVLTWRLPAALVDGRNTVAGVVIVVAGLYAGTLAVYARLQHFTAYGRTERAVKPDHGGIVYLTQRLTVAGEPHPALVPLNQAVGQQTEMDFDDSCETGYCFM